ncbi:MAG: hypothetical protein KC502_09295 [Myxococcales bacterium]|nr:hypothetical protein [Myxococcales bacterium]
MAMHDTVETPESVETAQTAPHLPLAIFSLAGDQVQMGAQHGALLRAVGGWQRTLDYYPRMVESIVIGQRSHPAQAALPLALRPVVGLALDRLHKRRDPFFRARTEAFYEALGVPKNQAKYIGVMDVLQNVIGLAGRVGVGDISERAMEIAPAACSTLAVWGDATEDGRLLHARNFDFPGAGVWEQAPSVVFCTPKSGLRYGFVTTRGADVPAVSVFNEAGLCLTIHTRFHKDINFSGNLAVDICHRVALHARTLADAVQLLKETDSASSWGILVSHDRSAALVEMTAGQFAVTYPDTDQPWLSCTNRYMAPHLQGGELEPSAGFLMHSDGRWAALERRAQAAVAQNPLSIEHLQSLLGDHGDHGEEGPGSRASGGILAQCNGVHSVVIDPERQTVDVSVGEVPTGHGPYVRIPWRWQDSPGVESMDLGQIRTQHTPTQRHRNGRVGQAYQQFLTAARIEMHAGHATDAEVAVEQACALDPKESSYRLLLAGYRLRRRDPAGALAHLTKALTTEYAPFYRARLLLWASRAAELTGNAVQAQTLRAELLALRHSHIGRYQSAAQKESQSPLPGRRLFRTRIQVQLCDLAA